MISWRLTDSIAQLPCDKHARLQRLSTRTASHRHTSACDPAAVKNVQVDCTILICSWLISACCILTELVTVPLQRGLQNQLGLSRLCKQSNLDHQSQRHPRVPVDGCNKRVCCAQNSSLVRGSPQSVAVP